MTSAPSFPSPTTLRSVRRIVLRAKPEQPRSLKPKFSKKAKADAEQEIAEPAEVAAEIVKVDHAQIAPTPAKPINADTFAEMDLPASVQAAIVKSGYTAPSEIQAAIIPPMLAGRDVIAQSQTGSGKTAAFALPLLARLKKKAPSPQVLILAPTRELAVQVSKALETYAGELPGFSVTAIYGGQDYDPQLRQLRRGVQVVVGTPGRVIDHVRRGSLSLEHLQCLVLDEADEMLNMGFLEDVEFVLEQCPEQKQVALFSATMPDPIRRIADRYLKNPHTVTIKSKTMTADSINQRAIFVPPRDKIELLRRIIEVEETDGMIIFTKTKESTTVVAEKLVQFGYSAAALNGDMAQRARERVIDQLKSGRLNIVVATDVAARGLDVSRLSHVVNFDLPHDNESYVHRIGRTGRAGRSGEAIIFLTNAQRGKLKSIERLTNQVITIAPWPTAEQINEKRIATFKSQITKTLAERDVKFFEDLISQYHEETGVSIEKIAAALAQVSQGKHAFLVKDVPRNESRQRDNRENDGRRERRDDVGERRPRKVGPVRPGMKRYRVEVGKADGVKPGNLVGAIANEAGIDSQFIGPINIQYNFTTVDLPADMSNEAFQTLQKTRVMGKPMQLRPDTGVPAKGRNFDGKKPFGKPNGFRGKNQAGGKRKPTHLKQKPGKAGKRR